MVFVGVVVKLQKAGILFLNSMDSFCILAKFYAPKDSIINWGKPESFTKYLKLFTKSSKIRHSMKCSIAAVFSFVALLSKCLIWAASLELAYKSRYFTGFFKTSEAASTFTIVC